MRETVSSAVAVLIRDTRSHSRVSGPITETINNWSSYSDTHRRSLVHPRMRSACQTMSALQCISVIDSTWDSSVWSWRKRASKLTNIYIELLQVDHIFTSSHMKGRCENSARISTVRGGMNYSLRISKTALLLHCFITKHKKIQRLKYLMSILNCINMQCL